MIKKIFENRWIFRSILKSIYFNFHYLPFKQAIKLPILLYKPHWKALKGHIIIDAPIRTGMICLGRHHVFAYPNNGIKYENLGGTIVFKGKCDIGSNSSLLIGKRAEVEFGDNFLNTSSIKLNAFYKVHFGKDCRIGWETMLMDTDFHRMKKMDGSKTKGYGEIYISDNCWIGNGCLIMKRTILPDHTIVQARSVLNTKLDIPSYCVIGMSSTPEIKINGLYRDIKDDVLEICRP